MSGPYGRRVAGSLAAIGASPHETHSLRQNARHGTVFSCYVSTKLCGGIAKDGGRLRPAILRSAGIPRPLATGPHEALALAGTGMRPGRRYEHLVRVPRHPHPRRWPASHARVSALPRLFATGSAALGIAAPAREHPLAVRAGLAIRPLGASLGSHDRQCILSSADDTTGFCAAQRAI